MSKPNGVRVALATCHDKHNYGSLLQAWATQSYLADCGFDVRTIDKVGLSGAISVGRRMHYARHIVDLQMYSEKAPFALHKLRQKVFRNFGAKMARRNAAFNAFSKRMFNLTRRPFTFDEARELSSEYDAIVVGSDQLWLPVNVAGNYFTLSWADPKVRKVAYATSFGVSSLDSWTEGRVGEFLSDFHAVSVREESGARIVSHATGQRPEVVCDPTMLLDATQWREVANNDFSSIPNEPYLLTYFLGRNAWQREAVSAYARNAGLKIVAIAHNDSYVVADEGYADVYPWDAGPAEWLTLIDNAALVCTDSFHGTVFSNIFQTPFVSFRRHTGGTQSTNSRMDTLLDMLQMQDRLCESVDELDRIASITPDFQTSGCNLEYAREHSAKWIKKSLEFKDASPSKCIEVHHKEECCGCAACASACPLSCIDMVYDSEGCEYPLVDKSQCVGCGRCVKACPVINVAPEQNRPQRAFLVQHKDPQVLQESTSGGAMTALSQAVIDNGGIVFGAGYLRDSELSRANGAPGRLVVGHFGVERTEDLGRFRNSKYVQSAIGPSYREVQHELAQGREVLFMGTPCQCEGLLTFLGTRSSNLRVVDVVCHATVCRAAFSSYVQWLDSHVGVADDLRFRDKTRYGYNYSNLRATTGGLDGQQNELYSAGVESDPYLRAFFSNLDDRLICYQCPFKKRYRESDMTCWDCFDVAKFGSAFDDNRGVTRVLVHSKIGQDLIDRISVYARFEELDVDAAVGGVREMVESVEPNAMRSTYMADIATLASAELIKKWTPDSAVVKAERLARKLAQRSGAYDKIKRVAKRVIGK